MTGLRRELHFDKTTHFWAKNLLKTANFGTAGVKPLGKFAHFTKKRCKKDDFEAKNHHCMDKIVCNILKCIKISVLSNFGEFL